MIDLYYWATPNGHKISIALEELGLPYTIKPVDIGKGDQFAPAFLAFSPNNRMPAIIDHEGMDGKKQTVFESGAILIYLSVKTGRLMPKATRPRIAAYEWLMWQMGGLGPMLGQAHHFNLYAPEKIPYAMERYSKEANRLYGVLDRRLAKNKWLAGREYSMADIACFPWTRTHDRQGVDMANYPHVARWRKAMGARPAVRRGMQAGAELHRELKDMSKEEWNTLFGGGK